MNRLLTIEMVPRYRGKEVIYVQGLGAVSAQAVTNINQASGLINTATSTLPTKPVTAQSDFSKVANSVATVAGVVAAVAVYIVPAGTVIAAVAGIVAAACVLLGKLFGQSKAKALAAERAQYETVTAQLQYENQQLDEQYAQTYDAIQQMRSLISGLGGLSGGGLGFCVFNCKKQREEDRLRNAKAEYELQNKLFTEKTSALMKLVDEFNKLMREYNSLLQASQTKNTALYVLLGAAAIGAGIVIYQSAKK